MYFGIANIRKVSKKITNNRLKVGDFVRISRYHNQFEKHYVGKWSREYFKIYRIIKGVPNTYRLKDLQNEIVEGKFYFQELQKITPDKKYAYPIEKIIKRDKDRILVQYAGWPSKFKSWVPVKQIKRL